LPSEWFALHSSSAAFALWDGVYNLFSLFMFVSVTIALRTEGMVGGARLVLSYCVGLFLGVFLTLLMPTQGPVFVHPGWFAGTEGLPSGTLAKFLEQTVLDYARSPGEVYACAGIAAMPSYHVYGWVCGFLYWRRLPRGVFLFGLGLTMLNWVSTVAPWMDWPASSWPSWSRGSHGGSYRPPHARSDRPAGDSWALGSRDDRGTSSPRRNRSLGSSLRVGRAP
jgi:hypothetical protein